MTKEKNRRLVQDPSGHVVSVRPEHRLKLGWKLYQPPAPAVKPAQPTAPVLKPVAPPSPPKAKD